MTPKHSTSAIYQRIAQILECARAGVARSVNTTQVIANWLIGREIVEAQQMGKKRALYGKGLLDELSKNLTQDFGTGYSVQALRYMRQFYQEFPVLISGTHLTPEITHLSAAAVEDEIRHTACGELDFDSNQAIPFT